MKVVGRKKEKDLLMQCILSPRPEFVVVYGRRRIGKTYLIKEFFNNMYSFYATGLSSEKTKGQLAGFNASLIEYGSSDKNVPQNWFEAFLRLRYLLENEKVYRDPINNKRIIFLDELPWMDTARSDFVSAFDYFWNSWASTQQDILLITCGSATSWIINNLLNDRKGFHNRITRQIHLLPFTLKECEELYELNNIVMTKSQMIESYMVFGGVPYYLNLFDSRINLTQNINELCFKEYGQLHNEYKNLFYSLYAKPEKHIAIIAALAKNRNGLNRVELSKINEIGGGSNLTKNLKELEECGFIRKFSNVLKEQNEAIYQLIDPFVLFNIKFIENRKINSWNEFINTPAYIAWRGNSFEIVCLNHIEQIKSILGISGIESNEYGWRSYEPQKGAPIDLIIDRKDGVINICEMKYTNDYYSLDAEEYEKILNRIAQFQKETKTKSSIHMTLVCATEYRLNKYSGIIQNIITGQDLFC